MQYFTEYIKELQKQKLTKITEHSHRAAFIAFRKQMLRTSSYSYDALATVCKKSKP